MMHNIKLIETIKIIDSAGKSLEKMPDSEQKIIACILSDIALSLAILADDAMEKNIKKEADE